MMEPAHEHPLAVLVARVHCSVEMEIHGCKELPMSENGIRGVDLSKLLARAFPAGFPVGN